MAGLYVHVPFRARPCLYDDSPLVLAEAPHASFLQAVQAELQHYAQHYAQRYAGAEPIRTIYIGGGRPSLLSRDELRRLLQTIREHFEAEALEEVTLEIHPADASDAYLRGTHELGIDRVSMDVISFYADDLERLQADQPDLSREVAVERLHDAGFDRFTIDLYFGWAEQPGMRWKANLQKADRLTVPHISIVECTGDQLAEASEDLRADQLQFAMEYLHNQGYEHYEISHFARPHHRGIHNQRHWNHSNYLGVGPSAHSFWWNGERAVRWSNVRNLARYEALIDQHHRPIAQQTELSDEDLAAEYVMLRLRTADGLDLDVLKSRYGFDLRAERADALARFAGEGYIELFNERHVRLTDRGKLVADTIISALLPD